MVAASVRTGYSLVHGIVTDRLERLSNLKNKGEGGDEAPVPLERLWKWHDRMRGRQRTDFNGKRAPEELV